VLQFEDCFRIEQLQIRNDGNVFVGNVFRRVISIKANCYAMGIVMKLEHHRGNHLNFDLKITKICQYQMTWR
jgi:hypothetical protein